MGEETIDTINETDRQAHGKQVLYMALTRNRDSELDELRKAIILFSRITKCIY